MDLDRLIARAKTILGSPRTQWPAVAVEPETISGLYRNYILVLAAIPPVCRFIKTSVIGYAWHGFRVYRIGIGAGLTGAVVAYGISLLAVFVLAIIIDMLASSFGGQQNRVQALKAAAYSYTGTWIAGFGQLLPAVGVWIALAGVLYSVYLLYLGLPSTMKAPAERAAGYTAVTVIVALVLGWLVMLVTGGLAGLSLTEGYG